MFNNLSPAGAAVHGLVRGHRAQQRHQHLHRCRHDTVLEQPAVPAAVQEPRQGGHEQVRVIP